MSKQLDDDFKHKTQKFSIFEEISSSTLYPLHAQTNRKEQKLTKVSLMIFKTKIKLFV